MSPDEVTHSRVQKILVVDDELHARRALARTLELSGFAPVMASNSEEACRYLSQHDVDAAFLDIMLGAESGMDLLRLIASSYSQVPVIMFTKLRDIEKAVAAVKMGAYDYLEKGCDNDRIVVTLKNALAYRELEVERNGLRVRLEEGSGLLGSSPALEKLREQIGKLARSEINVLILGETGTGKELVARSLHNQSRRAAKQMEIVDGTLLESLAEDTLFGHVKGAFTDAKEKREGAFVRADGGTLFLDELGKLGLPMQSKLLRVLEQGTFVPLGADRQVKVDVRFVGASNRSLEAMVRQGEFLEDLYHRLKVGVIRVPPLRERREDIRLLAEAFLSREFKRSNRTQQKLSENAGREMISFEWSGNVRQLENLCEYLVAVNEGHEIKEEDVREWLYDEERETKPGPFVTDYFSYLRNCKHEYFERLLIQYEGSVPQVARAAGIDKAGCYRLLRTLGLHPKSGADSTA